MKPIRGFAIVSAIFILVVLTAIGAAILNLSTSQQLGSAQDLQGVRAYQAARAGVEWGLYQVQSSTNYNFSYGTGTPAVGAGDPNLRRCPSESATAPFTSTSSFNPAAGTLAAFRVTVVCTRLPDSAGGTTVFQLRATACAQANASNECPNETNPGSLYVERRLELSF